MSTPANAAKARAASNKVQIGAGTKAAHDEDRSTEIPATVLRTTEVIKAQKGKTKDPSPDMERTDRMNPVELETNPANDDVSRSLLGAMTKAASATAPATTDESDDPDEDETHPVDAHHGLDSADSSTDKSSDSELEDIYMSQDSSSDDGPSTHEENL